MCPNCIGSALLALGGTGSAGGLTLIAARVLARARRAYRGYSSNPSFTAWLLVMWKPVSKYGRVP